MFSIVKVILILIAASTKLIKLIKMGAPCTNNY